MDAIFAISDCSTANTEEYIREAVPSYNRIAEIAAITCYIVQWVFYSATIYLRAGNCEVKSFESHGFVFFSKTKSTRGIVCTT